MNSNRGLDAVFHPRSVAVIGASDDPKRIGGRVVRYLKEAFPGTILPVNSQRSIVQGLDSVSEVSKLSTIPDFAVIAVPAPVVADVVSQLSQIGTPAALIFSSGFAETGESGRAEQARIRSIAQETGMKLIGPNCVGIISLPAGVIGTFASPRTAPSLRSGLAVVSQSGALGITFWNMAQDLGAGASYLATTGNEAGVTAAEMVEYMVEQEDVHTIMLFLEGINEPDRLVAAGLRAMDLEKPVIVMKVGTSAEGATAAISHTASLAVSDRLADAVLRRAGMIRVYSPTELAYVTAAFTSHRFPAGNRIGVMTVSGGVGVMVTDRAVESGLSLPRLSPSVEQVVREHIPSFGSALNPIDYTANVVNNPDSFNAVLGAVIADDAFDAVIVSGTSTATAATMAVSIQKAHLTTTKPILVYSAEREIVRTLVTNGVPAFEDPVLAASAMSELFKYRLRMKEPRLPHPLLSKGAPKAASGQVLAASATRELLIQAGLPLARELSTSTADATVEAAEVLGYPVAVKLDPQISAHKSDIGGVRLWLQNADQVREAVGGLFSLIGHNELANRPALIVQEMVAADVELMVGGTRDVGLGPIVVVGVGGRLVEILDQTAIGLAPLAEGEAMRLMLELCDGRLASNGRGLSGHALKKVASALEGVSRLLVEHPEVLEVDLNPLIVTHDRVVAVDALVRTSAI